MVYLENRGSDLVNNASHASTANGGVAGGGDVVAGGDDVEAVTDVAGRAGGNVDVG